jgi:hypothetical protein
MNRNERGFEFQEFTDRYGAKCSIQKSSLAFEDCIWLGIDKAEPKIQSPEGWIPFEVPEGVLISTRMHLTRQMVIDLLPSLVKFANTGDL